VGPFNRVDRTLEHLQIGYDLFNLLELVAALNVVHRTRKRFQISDYVVNLVEMVLMFCAINRTRHHFDVVKVFLYLVELMSSVDLQHRIVEIFQVGYFSLHIHEGMLVFYCVYRSN